MFDLNESSISSHSDLSATSEPDNPMGVEHGEIDMYALSIKSAIEEMTRRLGPETCLGEREPCDELWTTLYITQDGLSLSTTPDFEHDLMLNDELQVIISREEDSIIERALLKLSENVSPEAFLGKSPTTEIGSVTAMPSSSYHEDLMSLASPRIRPSQTPLLSLLPYQSKLLELLREAGQKSLNRGDYIESHSFQHAYHLLKSKLPVQFVRNDYSPVINVIASRIQTRGNHLLHLVRVREVWFSYLLAQRAKLDQMVIDINSRHSQTCCKMWYIHHVRESKVWQRAKDVCEALNKMKSSKPEMKALSAAVRGLKRNSSGSSLHRSTSMTRNPGSRFIPSRQSFDGFSFSARPASLYNVSFGIGSDDWFEILAAPSEQGGPHKLSDYQVDITNRWLEEHASENFCRGEEIIHRYMAEVNDVVQRLVPETADEMTSIASTFWESDEFLEDAKDFGLLELDRRMLRKEEIHNYGRRSEEIPRNNSGVDLLGLLNRSRGKTMGADISDTRSIRSNHSRTASMTINTRPAPDLVVRPGSSHSISFPPPPSPAASFFSRQPVPTTPMARSTSQVDEKSANEFLEQTRQRILSLLLSDLGGNMWCTGSETDEWFSDGLADACLERQRTRQASIAGGIQRTRKVASVSGATRRPSMRGFNFEEEPPTPPLSRETSDTGTNDASPIQFDFKAAYKELLRRFSVHPAPHEKLKALFSLERLIHASFVSMSFSDQHIGEAFGGAGSLPTPRPSIDMTRKVSSSSAVGTDDLIDKLQDILRDPDLRPKTLFRDLCFVSSFINPITLTHHGEGKVFWDIGLAALGMKEDVVNAMVGWYEEIMSGNERARSRRRESSSSVGVGGMKDAARMLVIAACEGNAVGQRELALLHLSHPSLLPLATMPLTRPSDIFHKASLRGTSTDKDKYDPDRIALATHWFKLAAKNGDKYAKSVEGNWLGSKKH